MNWLAIEFPKNSITWFLITSFVAAIFGFISAYLTYHFITRKTIIETKAIESASAKKERIRNEVIYWANPILGAVQELESILRNILNIQGYLALHKNYKQNTNPEWSITYEYMLYGTIYLFAQYFCWIRLLQEKLNFELFQSKEEQKEFFSSIHKVMKSLDEFGEIDSPKYGKNDWQVFELQQRAIGEIMIAGVGTDRRCLSYPEFLRKMSEDTNFSIIIEPLKKLLMELEPNNDGRWGRLGTTLENLIKLREICEKTLSLT